MKYEAIVKSTNEKVTVYKLKDGSYHDYPMDANLPAQSQTGNKEYKKDELLIGREIKP